MEFASVIQHGMGRIATAKRAQAIATVMVCATVLLVNVIARTRGLEFLVMLLARIVPL